MKTNEAFSRNLGWVTETEQKTLSQKTVAIAGCGGVGGHYAEVMARLGIQNFHLADPDSFEVVNFNRQNASGMSTVGRAKVEVIRDRILDINPNAKIKIFKEGVNSENLASFVEGVDLYLDGLDFFVVNERIELFEALRSRKIPAITVAPTGMGAALVVFKQGSMSFSDYFGLAKDQSVEEKSIRFLVGLTPSLVQRKYQVDRTRVDFQNQKVPSTPMGCYLCAGVAGTTALKILLNRGQVSAAPWAVHFDAYTMTYKKTYVWAGASNPLQSLKRKIVRWLTVSSVSELKTGA